MPEKSDLEKFAVIEFCDAYNRRHPGRHLTYVEGCRPPLPDTRCTLADQEVYIEVAHLYGYPSDAKRLLGRQGHSYPSAAEQQQARLTPLSVRIGDSLARVLQRKCERTYTTSAWLLVRKRQSIVDAFRLSLLPCGHEYHSRRTSFRTTLAVVRTRSGQWNNRLVYWSHTDNSSRFGEIMISRGIGLSFRACGASSQPDRAVDGSARVESPA